MFLWFCLQFNVHLNEIVADISALHDIDQNESLENLSEKCILHSTVAPIRDYYGEQVSDDCEWWLWVMTVSDDCEFIVKNSAATLQTRAWSLSYTNTDVWSEKKHADLHIEKTEEKKKFLQKIDFHFVLFSSTMWRLYSPKPMFEDTISTPQNPCQSWLIPT